MKGQRGDSNLF